MKSANTSSMTKDRKLQIDFSGTAYIDAIESRFVKFTEDSEAIINGEVWLELPENERAEYVLMSLSDTLINSNEISELEIDIEEESEEE
jgi:hypothetical protein